MKWFYDLKIATTIIASFALVGILSGFIAYIQNHHFPIFVVACSVLLGIAAGILISRNISGQLKQVSSFAQRIAAGDINETIDMDTNSEIGSLAICLKKLAESQKEMAQTATRIAQGDFLLQVNVRNDKDALGKAMQRCVQNIQLLKQEIARMTEAAESGKLTEHCKADAFQGGYATLLEGVNQMLDALIKPVGRAIKVMNKVGSRNLTARLTGEYKGDHATFQNALNLTIQTLDEALSQVSMAAEQVSNASLHISEGSQVLSQRASEQAGSIEEVSSSLHEVASMTRQNSDNAREARSLSKSAETAVEEGVESMNRLSEAIGRIKESSDSTAKIIKTIDEIAFQTNLLALNAAVEAARAGDAGKGFAVVAEEVRNLAMRSAEAAKNTANLIEESQKNSENGVNLNQEVLKNLNEINGQVKKVGSVMAEIAAASEQQTQGVDQVNSVINQMNIVTQQIAANAEESASGAEELSGQAEELKSMVRTFQLSKALLNPAGFSMSRAARTEAGQFKAPAESQSMDRRTAEGSKIHAQTQRTPAARASGLIPFDESDPAMFGEF
ncbi:MAG: HAMP domain-containing protein [Acidobacteria bacterium]|nr:HAMP domain-containing protein [Acidobacteriota bacterium]